MWALTVMSETKQKQNKPKTLGANAFFSGKCFEKFAILGFLFYNPTQLLYHNSALTNVVVVVVGHNMPLLMVGRGIDIPFHIPVCLV